MLLYKVFASIILLPDRRVYLQGGPAADSVWNKAGAQPAIIFKATVGNAELLETLYLILDGYYVGRYTEGFIFFKAIFVFKLMR